MATRIKIELDSKAMGRLIHAAVAERRPADLQAEVLLLRALGLDPEPITPPPAPESAPEEITSTEKRPDDPVGEAA